MRLLRTVSWLDATLSTWIVMPVAFAKSASEAAKLVSSPPVHWTWIETFLPLNGLLGAERLVELGVAGRDRRHGCRRRGRSRCARRGRRAWPQRSGRAAARRTAAGGCAATWRCSSMRRPAIMTTTANADVIRSLLVINSSSFELP